MSSIHHGDKSANLSGSYSLYLCSEQIKMLKEAAENPDGCVIARELEEVAGVCRSTALRYAAELVELGLLSRSILSGTENKYRPTYVYTLTPIVTKKAIQQAFYTNRLIIGEDPIQFEQGKGRNGQECSDENTELLPDDNIFSPENANPTSEVNEQTNTDFSSEELPSEILKDLSRDNTDEPRTVTLDEILEVFGETTKILMDKIAEQDERIAQLEKQLLIFKATGNAKDPREVLRDVRCRFNLELANVINGNGCSH